MTTEPRQFPVVRRGYDPSTIDGHLERLENSIVMLTADRDAAAEKSALLSRQLNAARTEAERLADQLSRLTEPPENVENMSERIQWMLKLSRDEAEEIRRKAAIDAAEIIAQADEIRSRNEEMRAEIDVQRAELESTREDLLAAAHDEANRVRLEAAEEQARLDSESVARRAKIEEEFAAAMAERRTEALATLASTEATSRDEAERRRTEATELARKLVAEASETARRKIANSELQLAQMEGMRRQVADQLFEFHAALEQLLDRVQPQDRELPGELPAAAVDSDGPVDDDGPTARTDLARRVARALSPTGQRTPPAPAGQSTPAVGR